MHAENKFEQLRFVLVETSHPGNVGAAARAMKTMGFSQLYLVSPRFDDVLTQPEAVAFASGAQDILENAKIVSSVAEAIQDCSFVVAVSARLREFSPPVLDSREFSSRFMSLSDRDAALVFGNERFGLPNEIVSKCNALVNISANPQYSSLNLAQAVQVLAYETRMALISRSGALDGDAQSAKIGFNGELASSQQIEGMYEHLEQALIKIDFLDPENPKKLMPRLKRLFARTQLEVEEVNIIRGIAKKMIERLK